MPWSGWTTLCGCSAKRSSDLDPQLKIGTVTASPSRAGSFRLGRGSARHDADVVCLVRVCHQCGTLYACPEGE